MIPQVKKVLENGPPYAALDEGVPLTLIGESVFARCLSAIKEERVAASKVLCGPKPKFEGDKKAFIDDIRKALYASKIVSYAQGYTLNAGSGSNLWLESQLRRNCFNVARWLYNSFCLPWENQRSI